MFFLQMSSFFFFLISPIMLYLLHPYARERSLAIHMVWVLMIFVGKLIFSLYTDVPVSLLDPMKTF